MPRVLADNGLFQVKQENTATKQVAERVMQVASNRLIEKNAKNSVKGSPNRVKKTTPKIHLKRKTQIKRFALWANGKKVERWYTADAGW